MYELYFQYLYLATLDTENMQRIIKILAETGSIWVVKMGKKLGEEDQQVRVMQKNKRLTQIRIFYLLICSI